MFDGESLNTFPPKIRNKTRCPISPFLFNSILEDLAIAIRKENEKEEKGEGRGGEEREKKGKAKRKGKGNGRKERRRKEGSPKWKERSKLSIHR